MTENIFYFLKKRRKAWLALILLIWAVFGYLAFQINIQEDISKTFPQDESLEQYEDFYRRSPLASKIVVAIGSDSIAVNNSHALIEKGLEFIAEIDSGANPLIDTVQFEFGVQNAGGSLDFFYENLPYFLPKEDVDSIFSTLDSTHISDAVQNTLQKLISPESYALKSFLLKDPLGFYPTVLQNLSGLQEGGDFKLMDKHLFTEDEKYILLFIDPDFPASESKKGGKLLDDLNAAKAAVEDQNPGMEVYLFGGPVIAAKNAGQIRKDTQVAGTLAIVLILSLLFWYYRKWLIPLLFLLPPLFGMTMAVGAIYLIKGEISILTVAAGTIVLGIALDYCFHTFTHLKHSGSIIKSIKDISWSLTLSCLTTILAFTSLLFLKSEILTDFGLLASFSLTGTLVFVLFVLPQIIDSGDLIERIPIRDHWLDKIFKENKAFRRPLFVAIIVITIVLAPFVKDVSFEDDLNKINYFPEELQQAEAIITNSHSQSREKSVYVVSKGKSFQDALNNNAGITQKLDSLKANGAANSIVSLNHIFPSSAQGKDRIRQWNRRIEQNKNQSLIEGFKQQGRLRGMKDESFGEFYNLLQTDFPKTIEYPEEFLEQPLFENFAIPANGGYELINIVNANAEDIPKIENALKNTSARIVNKSLMAQGLVDVVSDNFNLLLIITTSLVFLTLLINYGRIEIALMTFVPMIISWFWILGICGLFDIKFNFVNVLVTTFIFGLGDDFCIFVTDGLSSKFKLGVNKLKSYRSSIVLSTATTIIGTGVLLFAKHPALSSIATLSVIGMLCISFVSLTLQPVIFHFCVEKRKEKGLAPLTLFIILTTIISFGYFALGCIVLTALIPVFYILPLRKKYKKRAINYIISKFAWSVIYIMINVRKRKINEHAENFEKPAILIANHQSFIDILAMVMLHPKILILTNEWVWRSPLFGRVVRYAGFPTAVKGLDDNLENVEESIEQGYSIAIFPEGTRSVDGKIKRFHKGAFFLAEKYDLDIIPVLLHGFNYTIRKGDYILLSGHLTIKILKRIEAGDPGFGESYSQRTKNICAYMRQEFDQLKKQHEDTEYHKDAVIANYIYKGPFLEWYVKIKLKIENNFRQFHEYCPREGVIYDIGCGFGYLTYMLHYTGPERKITGVDYDEYKIRVARECYAKNENTVFVTANLSDYFPPAADCYIIKDVLHYLPGDRQEELLVHCAQNLNPGGRMIVRDGFVGNEKHRKTELTEYLSTRLLNFNKTENDLSFLEVSVLTGLAEKFNLKVLSLDKNKRTSNQTFILTKE